MPQKRVRNRPVVALVGRANVGKSTLWNRLTETQQALVSNLPNTTRDRNYAPVIWRGASIDVVDTGGMDAEQGSEIGRGILRQAEIAIHEADLVLFMIDVNGGVLQTDHDLARRVKAQNPNIILVANKADNLRQTGLVSSKESWGLGLGEPIACSAGTGRGVGDLLDLVYADLTRRGKFPVPLEHEGGLRLVVMGRPNVGKSSIVNAILGEERVIVSPVAHTTREPMDTHLVWRDERITLVDTAGMRKRAKIDTRLEDAAMERNQQALKRADIAFLVLDVTDGAHEQDKHLAGLLKDAHKGLVIVANKWDLVDDKNTRTVQEYEMRIRRDLPFLQWAPIVFTSAKKEQRTTALLEIAFRIREERRREVSYNALQRLLKNLISQHPPMQAYGPQSPYIHDFSQIGVDPPTFLINVRGEKANIHPSWLRFLENRLREKFGFEGTPLMLTARVAPLVRKEMPQAMKDRPQRRKPPIGRRPGQKTAHR